MADFYNNRVRRIDAVTHVITTVGGDGTSTSGSLVGEGGPAVDAPIGYPLGLAVGSDGSVYVASEGPPAIRASPPTGRCRRSLAPVSREPRVTAVLQRRPS